MATDLGLAESAVERLAGEIAIRGRLLSVRIESLRITEESRGHQSLFAVMNHLRAIAREAEVNRLVIEGVAVGNAELARILVRRFGGVYTTQRTIVIDLLLE